VSSEDVGAVAEGDAPEAPEETARAGWRRPLHWFGRLTWWQEGLLLVVLAVLIAALLKSFVVQTYSVAGPSMEPTLHDQERMLVKRFGGDPQRGDLVVFEDPGGWLGEDEADQGVVTSLLSALGLYPTGGHLVKRVIGVEGDTIVCCTDDGLISVNGQPLEEDYLAELRPGAHCNGPMISTCDWSAGPVPAGKVFVMGDNRSNSDDSSYHLCRVDETDCTRDPYVDLDEIVGTVSAVAWPISAWKRLHRPDVFDSIPEP